MAETDKNIFNKNTVIYTSGTSKEYWNTSGPKGITLKEEVAQAWEAAVKGNPSADTNINDKLPERYRVIFVEITAMREWSKGVNTMERKAFDEFIAKSIRTSNEPDEVFMLNRNLDDEHGNSGFNGVLYHALQNNTRAERPTRGHGTLTPTGQIAEGRDLNRAWDALRGEFADAWLKAVKDESGKVEPAKIWVKDNLTTLYQSPIMNGVSNLRQEFQDHPEHKNLLPVFDQYVAERIRNSQTPDEVKRIGIPKYNEGKSPFENIVDELQQWQKNKVHAAAATMQGGDLHPAVVLQVAKNAIAHGVNANQAIETAANIDTTIGTKSQQLGLG